MTKFKLKSDYKPTGDQPQAIEKLAKGVNSKLPHQVLLGVTGSGKTYTVANVIEQTGKPTLIISHNKTLAAQLYQEFKEYFPNNAVGFFISYYDYYLPESYIPQTDTYIAKETEVNEEIDRLRLEATSFVLSRKDAIVIASVSCIYNIGSPTEYGKYVIHLYKGLEITQKELARRLVGLHYEASRWNIERGQFRKRAEMIEIYPAYGKEIVRVWIEDDKVTKITTKPPLGKETGELDKYFLYPAKHYLTDPDTLDDAFIQIKRDLDKRVSQLKKEGKLVEAQRLEQRVEYDLEMIAEIGYVNGIENYSRYFDGRTPGDPPNTLIDFFRHSYGDDFLTVVDESHITIPQIGGMYRGDQSRKQTLIDFGFRLPSCLDNRPMKFEEFLPSVPQIIHVSATPKEWEIKKSKNRVVEQLIRPTGLVEPEVDIRPAKDQVEDLIKEILKRVEKKERVLVTTLTKKMAEDLSEYLKDIKNTQGKKIKVSYVHADIHTLDRTKILNDLRTGHYDVIVGINLLREGLDLPEVSLVTILDADAYGFLRSKTSLIQIMGRAARNSAGTVILYADKITEAMKEAVKEIERRRKIQLTYNKKHKITPKTIKKPIRQEIVKILIDQKEKNKKKEQNIDPSTLTPNEIKKEIKRLTREMNLLASALEFEAAARIRDNIVSLKEWLKP